jgi:ELWxxDGT repeat protein
MNKRIAMILCLLMASATITGCIGGNDDSTTESDDKLDDWNVHYAATSADLPICDEITNGRLYYVESGKEFQVCKTSGWEVIAIQGVDGKDGDTGLDGTNGADGAPGVDGTEGAVGADGQDGVSGEKGDDGEDGVSTLIRVLSSTDCTTGGNTFEIGDDTNGDGVLDLTEVILTLDICNGAQGATGADGAQGPAGADGAQGATGADGAQGATGADGAQGPAGADGAQGPAGADGDRGVNGLQGADGPQGADGADGAQGATGADGAQGPAGTPGSAGNNGQSIMIQSGTSSADCLPSSVVKEHGIDTDGDGSLSANEISYTVEMCQRYAQTVLPVIPSGQGIQYNGIILFVGNDGIHGNELWRTDGTVSGTWIVKDIRSGVASSGLILDVSTKSAVLAQGFLYFSANDGIHGNELWRTDGTSSGTVLAKDIQHGTGSSNPTQLTATNGGSFYLSATIDAGVSELVKFWGEDIQRFQKPIYNSVAQTTEYFTWFQSPNGITVHNNSLTFIAKENGSSLFSLFSFKINACNMNNDCFDPIKEFSSGVDQNLYSLPVLNEEVYFTGDTGSSHELYKVDSNQNLDYLSSYIASPTFNSAVGTSISHSNYLLFSANTGNGIELHMTDGTATGTSIVQDINSGTSGSNPSQFVISSGEVIFTATAASSGKELYKIIYTSGGPTVSLIIDLWSGSSNGVPGSVAPLVYGNGLLFIGEDGSTGSEIWTTGGTASTTDLFIDLTTTSFGGMAPVAVINGKLVMKAVIDSSTNPVTIGLMIFEMDDQGMPLIETEVIIS